MRVKMDGWAAGWTDRPVCVLEQQIDRGLTVGTRRQGSCDGVLLLSAVVGMVRFSSQWLVDTHGFRLKHELSDSF